MVFMLNFVNDLLRQFVLCLSFNQFFFQLPISLFESVIDIVEGAVRIHSILIKNYCLVQYLIYSCLLLALNILISVCIFSILFSVYLLRC